MSATSEILYQAESYAIIGAAMEVQNELGMGFSELVYHEALNIELGLRNIPFESEKEIRVAYKGHVLERMYKADLVCYGDIIVELKMVDALKTEHTAQLLNYLAATNKPLGILINFGAKPMTYKVVPNYVQKKRND
jgi:GxxExxY protein